VSAAGLASQQVWLEGAILGPQPVAAEVEARLTAGPRMSAEERLDVYRKGYRARLVECLADDYPAVKDLLGDDGFESLASSYVERFPSHSPSLNRYGERMADLLRERDDAHGAFASDLARLEWALVEAIHAAPAGELDPQRLATIAAGGSGGLRLVAGPSVRLLRLDHPVNRYYQAFHDGASRGVEAGRAATLVHRKGWVVWRRDVSPAMAVVLGEILAGATLGAALAAAEERGAVPEASEVTEAFRDWVAGGVFSDALVAG
jgi:hypothetical protein